MRKKIFPLFFIFLLLIGTSIVTASFHNYNYGNRYNGDRYNYGGYSGYNNYDPYRYSQGQNSRYLLNIDYSNITLPLCYDPSVRTTIAMSNTYGFTYCVKNYYYRQENKDNAWIQLVRAIIQETEKGNYGSCNRYNRYYD